MKLFFSNSAQERYVAKVMRRALSGFKDTAIKVAYGHGQRKMVARLYVEFSNRDLYDAMIYCNEQFQKYEIVNATASIIERQVEKDGQFFLIQELVVSVDNIKNRAFYYYFMDLNLSF